MAWEVGRGSQVCGVPGLVAGRALCADSGFDRFGRDGWREFSGVTREEAVGPDSGETAGEGNMFVLAHHRGQSDVTSIASITMDRSKSLPLDAPGPGTIHRAGQTVIPLSACATKVTPDYNVPLSVSIRSPSGCLWPVGGMTEVGAGPSGRWFSWPVCVDPVCRPEYHGRRLGAFVMPATQVTSGSLCGWPTNGHPVPDNAMAMSSSCCLSGERTPIRSIK